MKALAALISAGTIIVVLFFLGLTKSEAYDDCQAWAYFVEAASRSGPEKRARQWKVWKRLANTRQKRQTIIRAEAYVKAGGNAAAAWKQCTGY